MIGKRTTVDFIVTSCGVRDSGFSPKRNAGFRS